MLDRLQQLEANVTELKLLHRSVTLQAIQSDKQREWALRYGLMESIQIIIDVSCHLASKYNLGSPKTYSECVELLTKFQYLTEELSKKLIGMIGLRNILVHDYIEVNLERLYQLLDNVDDMTSFADAVKFYV
ncbi:MAG: DUF86 domain-containing protein [Bacteroidota bacterium]|jgi:uncharacterized protein YutE (UPF0331/DUF86 family)